MFTKSLIKDGLTQCTEAQRIMFKRMYAPLDLEMDMDEVVEQIPESKLDWALKQVQNTLK